MDTDKVESGKWKVREPYAIPWESLLLLSTLFLVPIRFRVEAQVVKIATIKKDS
jgi:hypothetical protein